MCIRDRIRKLVLRYGADGYAIYFHCIELIAGSVSEHNITFELEHDAEIIADNLKIQGTSDTSAVDRVNQIMKYIVSLGLFEESKGRIFLSVIHISEPTRLLSMSYAVFCLKKKKK